MPWGFSPHQMKISSIVNNLLADIRSRETLLITRKYSKWQKIMESMQIKILLIMKDP